MLECGTPHLLYFWLLKAQKPGWEKKRYLFYILPMGPTSLKHPPISPRAQDNTFRNLILDSRIRESKRKKNEDRLLRWGISSNYCFRSALPVSPNMWQMPHLYLSPSSNQIKCIKFKMSLGLWNWLEYGSGLTRSHVFTLYACLAPDLRFAES